ncbi:MAG: TRAP transporter large permease [Betaproteobacteria bacterium]|nr:MAG: TRAP transporter large permease [Betaproteobacteria bacterium]
MLASIIGFLALIGISLAGVPMAFAMFAIGVVGFALFKDWNAAFYMAGQISYETAQNYGLSVVPMFVLMGNLINHSGLSKELYAAANAFLGHRRGGLAMATIAACGGFAAVCGSSVATAATLGKVAIPEMRRFGYADSLAAGSVAAGGTLGILIPPSVVMVIYGILTSTDIGKLFAAGILPGLLGILLYMGAVKYTVWRDPDAGPPGPRVAWPARWKALANVWAVAALFIMVIGGIYLGVFTPTEAAGIGAFGAFIVALLRRTLTLSILLRVLAETVRTSAVLFMVLIGGLVFSNFVNIAGMPDAISRWVTGLEISPAAVLLTILGIYVLLGCVLESMTMILLTIPVFFPIVQKLGFDPVWFGIIVVVVTEVSLITPPVGLNVFVISGIFRDIGTATVFRGITPFLVADIVRIAILVLVPWIVLVLPSMMR